MWRIQSYHRKPIVHLHFRSLDAPDFLLLEILMLFILMHPLLKWFQECYLWRLQLSSLSLVFLRGRQILWFPLSGFLFSHSLFHLSPGLSSPSFWRFFSGERRKEPRQRKVKVLNGFLFISFLLVFLFVFLAVFCLFLYLKHHSLLLHTHFLTFPWCVWERRRVTDKRRKETKTARALEGRQ